ncbi:hypothetical protein ACFQO7_23785 [Catellatospora aurea]|uniref:Uncharacterized protein n=1 Tax=Catellatospora aurea TaxID=1337874 RepID=A0ABW2H0Y5_9ACTN
MEAEPGKSYPFFAGRPRLAAAFVVLVLAVVAGAHLFAHHLEMQPPRNDPVTLEQLRLRFADKAWEPDLAAAHWDSRQLSLTVFVAGADRQQALDMCADITAVVVEHTGGRRRLTIYTTPPRTMLATNFLVSEDHCYWRGG